MWHHLPTYGMQATSLLGLQQILCYYWLAVAPCKALHAMLMPSVAALSISLPGKEKSVIPNSFRYVNRMINVAYLTGTVRRDPNDKQQFYLVQTANPALDIPVRLPNPDFALPGEYETRTVIGHVRGRVGEYGQTAVLEAISIQPPSVLTINPLSSYLAGFAKRIPKDKIPETLRHMPYNRDGSLRDEVLQALRQIDNLTPEEHAIIDLYEQYSGRMRGRFDSNSNVVLLAGVVHRFAYIPPNEHQSHGQGMVMLRQHKDADLVVPVRVVNNRAAQVLQQIKPGVPVMLKGRVRRKVMPTPDGSGILSDVLLVETDMLTPASQNHVLPPVPAWLGEYLRTPSDETANSSQADAA